MTPFKRDSIISVSEIVPSIIELIPEYRNGNKTGGENTERTETKTLHHDPSLHFYQTTARLGRSTRAVV
jgi:hypothetical protein